jgi:hypothetical protein
MLTRTIGWCAAEPFNVPLVTESAFGKRAYEVNGCSCVTSIISCASVEIGVAEFGDSGAPASLQEVGQEERISNTQRTRIMFAMIAV